MKYILGIITTLLIILSFTIKCDHRYTGIEAVKISAIPNAVLTIAHCGIQPGKRLICVKCYHEVDQQVDYGSPLTFGSDINSDSIKWSWNQKAVWESDYKQDRIQWGSSGSIASDNSFTYDTLNKKSPSVQR